MTKLTNWIRGVLGTIALVAVSLAAPVHAQERVVIQMIDGDGGVPLKVVDAGNPDGPVILFIHGMAQSTLSFERQFNSSLADDFRLVAFDLRGHAGSGKPWQASDYAGSRVWASDVAAVIEALDLNDVTIVGWSFGGFVAVSYIRHFGHDRLSALNLVGTSAGLVEFQAPPTSSFEDAMDSQARRASMDIAVSSDAMNEMPESLTAAPMEARDRALAYRSALMLPSYAMRLFGNLPLDNKDMPFRVTVPTLLSIGTKDVGMDVPSAHRLDAALPSSTLSLYEGYGHFPSYEDADRFNRELAAFVTAYKEKPKQACECPTGE